MLVTQPKARKEHVCYECNLTIEKGEKHYKFVVFKGEGDFDEFGSWRVHRFCNDECGKLHKEQNWDYDEYPTMVDDVLPKLWKKWGVYKFLTASALVDQLQRKLLNLQFRPGDSTERINNLMERLAHAHAEVPAEIFDTLIWSLENGEVSL